MTVTLFAEPLRDCSWYEIIHYDNGDGTASTPTGTCIIPPNSVNPSSSGNDLTTTIPNWVNSQFVWYIDGDIDEKTLLTSMNWMFDNNIMHLSPEAAQEVNDLRVKVAEQESAISSLRTLVSSQAMSDDSGEFWFETLQPGYYENASGERIMQPEYGTTDNTQSQVIVRGWDPVSKEEILGQSKSTSDTNKESVQRFIVELYAKSLHSSQGIIWLPMTEGNVVEGFEHGDPHKPIIIGRIYNPETKIGDPSGEFWFETLKPGVSESTTGTQISPSQTKVLIMASVSDFDFASKTVDDILRKGGTTSAWESGITAFSQQGMNESVVPELAGIVVLCNTEISKKIQSIDAELKILEQWLEMISKEQESASSYDASGRLTSDTTESSVQYRESDLDFITRNLSSIDQEVMSLNTGIEVLEEKLSSVGDDAQLANIDLQNSLQKQQQTLQTMSNVSKILHDTAMSIIRNMR